MTDAWALDPLPILRNAHTQLVDVGGLEGQFATAAPDVTTSARSTPEMFEQAMSAGLRDVTEQYRSAHGAVNIRLLRYVRSVNGTAEVILDAGASAPREEDLVHITVAVSAVDSAGLRVVAEVLVAARTSS